MSIKGICTIAYLKSSKGLASSQPRTVNQGCAPSGALCCQLVLICQSGSTTSVPLHRCLALTLYHGCSVFVHLLSAYLLSRRREAHFQHERIKCLTLLVAFVIMMVGPFLILGLLLSFTLIYPVCGPFQEVCSVLLSSRLCYSSAHICKRADPPPVLWRIPVCKQLRTGLIRTYRGCATCRWALY